MEYNHFEKPKKQTFTERFSRVYDYPYGSSYLSSYLNEPGREIMENLSFERTLQRERDMRPFHVQCPITMKKICFCKKNNDINQSMLSTQYQKLAYEQQLFYEGFPNDTFERVQEKMKFERERMLNIKDKTHIDTFENFMDFNDDDVEQTSNAGAQQHLCSQCQGSLDKNDKSKGICAKCQSLALEQQKSETKKRITKQNDKNAGAPNNSAQKKKEKAQPQPAIESARETTVDKNKCQKCQEDANNETQATVIECSKCHQRYHDKCHDPPLSASLVKKIKNSSQNIQNAQKWECPDCKVCQVCHLSNDENKIIICEMCDIAVHIHCLKPPLLKVPEKNWFCNNCIQCLSCKKTLESVTRYSDAKWNRKSKEAMSGKQRLCSKCYECYKQGNFCSICNVAYEEDCSDNFVGCDECERWIHAECDNINQAEFVKFEKDNTKYTCPHCRKK